MRYTKPQPSQQELRTLFDYCDNARRAVNGLAMRGGLVRKKAPLRLVCGTMKPGRATRAAAGVPGHGVHYLHRLIWIWHNGIIPPEMLVDHRDNDPTNNRIGNLRLLTDAGNQVNRRSSRKGASVPYIGVCVSHGRYSAFVSAGGRAEYLGGHSDPIAAALARDAEIERRHPGIATLNRDLFPEVREKYQPKSEV